MSATRMATTPGVPATTMSKLTLNIARVHVPDIEISVGAYDYHPATGRQKLQELRNRHDGTHVFLRDGNEILSVATVPDCEVLGDRCQTAKLSDRLRLTAVLVRNAMVRYLRRIDRPVVDHFPLSFIAAGPQHNLLAAALPRHLTCPEWLAVRPLYLADIRVFHFDREAPFVGIAFDVRTTRQITRTCKDLLDEGFCLVGCYVGQLVAHPDKRLEPRLRLLGRVERVDGDLLRLTDIRVEDDAVNAINATDARIEPRWEAFDRCVEHAFGKDASQVTASLAQSLASSRQGLARLEKLRAAADHLSKEHIEIVPGVNIEVRRLLASQDGARFPRLEEAPRPVYVFDPTGSRTNTWHDAGLKQFGPYSGQTFDKNRPRLCIICQASRKGQVEQLLHKFLRGVTRPNQPPHKQPFPNGFIQKYALDDVATEFFLANGDSVPAYQKAVQQAIEKQTDTNLKWDLALVQIEDRFRDLPDASNPYLHTKVDFLTHQIPVQEFRIETAGLHVGQLAYALNNMALATYAKLGGIPWLIRSDRAIAHELVIGIGSALVGHGRLGERRRIVGITTVFSGDGNYWLANLTRTVQMPDYEAALLESLRATIMKVRHDMNWQARDHVRLVFHAFKPFRNTEATAVKALMDELGDYDVDYAFIHVEDSHPYLLFDELQPGVRDYDSGKTKGQFAPKRGRFLRISGREVLMFLTGPNDIKRPEDGMPHPVLMNLHAESTFQDTTYLARQMYAFACHSWRSFFPSSLPVTILYSELIAGLLGHLAAIPKWNPETVMAGRIGRTRWFL